MKFTQVFVILSLLFAISFAVPSKWEDGEVKASNEKEVEEKRALTWLFVKTKKKLLGSAIKAVCNLGSLPDNMKGVCECGSDLLGDEEAEFEENKRSFDDAWSYLKKTTKSVCGSWIGKFISGTCKCVQLFI